MKRVSSRKAPSKRPKPAKPYPDFPLFPHATGRWAKKIRGKLHYFGPWSDPRGAVQKYLDQRDDLYAGRTPRARTGGLTVRELANRFLTAKKRLCDTGELSNRSFLDYHATCARIISAFGLDRPVDDLHVDDFDKLRSGLASMWGPVALGNEIQRVRSVFKYAADNRLILAPVHFGTTFKRPHKRVFRKLRNEKGPRLFDQQQIHSLLETASVHFRAMILLGINCGFGNQDVALLPLSGVDLDRGWVNFPRPKTGIGRRVPLWPETVAALRASIAKRISPKDARDAHLVFITKYGMRWSKETSDNPISKECAKLLEQLGIKRPGINFYALRHTFETVGGASKDQVAVDTIMGHADDPNDMAAVYREGVEDDRLVAVVEHVRAWLFGKCHKRHD